MRESKMTNLLLMFPGRVQDNISPELRQKSLRMGFWDSHIALHKPPLQICPFF